MPKIFKQSSTSAPRSLSRFERGALEEVQADVAEPEEQITPEMLLAEAREEAERLLGEARTTGLQLGIEAGKAEYAARVAESAQAMTAAAEAIKEAHERFLASLESEVVELSMTIASHILHREVQADRGLVLVTVRKALRNLSCRERMSVRVHPDDLAALRNERVALLDEFDGVQELSIQADETITPGGCVVESSLMQVDARVEAQLQSIFQALRDPVKRASEGDGLDVV